MATSSNWHFKMHIYGGNYREAKRCTRCKPYCSVFDLLATNRFTATRNLPGWYKKPRNPFMKEREYTQWPQPYRRPRASLIEREGRHE